VKDPTRNWLAIAADAVAKVKKALGQASLETLLHGHRRRGLRHGVTELLAGTAGGIARRFRSASNSLQQRRLAIVAASC